jgi:hypothetical protein
LYFHWIHTLTTAYIFLHLIFFTRPHFSLVRIQQDPLKDIPISIDSYFKELTYELIQLNLVMSKSVYLTFRLSPVLNWVLFEISQRSRELRDNEIQLMEQELPILSEHLSSVPVLSGVRVTRSLVLCVCFVDRYLSFYAFSFGHCVVCSSSIYGFWLPLWYLQTLLKHDILLQHAITSGVNLENSENQQMTELNLSIDEYLYL